ncbi:hypothetical protein [Chromobacterium amazonense]
MTIASSVLQRVSIISSPSQMARTRMVGPNSFSTWRQAPQGGVGVSVGV